MDLKSFLLGATLAGGTATLAGIDDASAKLRDLSTGPITSRAVLYVDAAGAVVGSVEQRAPLTDDAKAAGAAESRWSVDVTCAPDVLQRVVAACPVDGAKVPEAFKQK